MLELSWTKCQDNNECDLLALNLENDHFDNLVGIYIIWHSGLHPAVVRLGQGIIKDRLREHRSDSEILYYEKEGKLYATWADVSQRYIDGVERYLANTWNPKIGSSFPDVNPIEVNSPWK